MRLTVGTHNLLDGEGTATPFAKLLLFTEAIAYLVRQQIGDTHEVRSCPDQRDLVLAWDRDLAVKELGDHYRLAHRGTPEVTPHRGTWINRLEIEGERIKIPLAHRINAAFPPYKRGEALMRGRYWERHQDIDTRLIRGAMRRGWHVIAGGDLNAPPNVLGYPAALGLAEARKGLDRIATSGRIAPGSIEVLSRMGSDHPRLRVEVIL